MTISFPQSQYMRTAPRQNHEIGIRGEKGYEAIASDPIENENHKLSHEVMLSKKDKSVQLQEIVEHLSKEKR